MPGNVIGSSSCGAGLAHCAKQKTWTTGRSASVPIATSIPDRLIMDVIKPPAGNCRGFFFPEDRLPGTRDAAISRDTVGTKGALKAPTMTDDVSRTLIFRCQPELVSVLPPPIPARAGASRLVQGDAREGLQRDDAGRSADG